jgi:hypothetical protein
VVSPMLMLILSKHSFSACGMEPIAAQDFLQCYADLLLHGLLSQPSQPFNK